MLNFSTKLPKSVHILHRKTGRRGYSSNNGNSGVTKAFVVGSVLASGTIAGGLAYEYVNPKFRSTVEVQFPGIKTLNKYVLGDSPGPTTIKEVQFSSSSHKVVPLPINGKEFKVNDDDIVRTKSRMQKKGGTKESVESSPKAESELTVKKATNENSDKHEKGKVRPSPYEGAGDAAKKNGDLDARLRSALMSAEKKTHDATKAKLNHISAVEAHIAAIKAAVEAGPEADWDAVTVAHLSSQRAAKNDIDAEADGRNYIDNLNKVISDGIRGEETVLNPLLHNAKETAQKLKGQLDEMNKMFKTVESEQIFMKDYAHIVDQGRKRFTEELQAVLPSVDLNKNGNNLGEDQLNTLLAHAHLKVDQLRSQLYEQQLREEERITRAVSDEKEKQLAEVKTKLEKEIREHEREKESTKCAAASAPIKTLQAPKNDSGCNMTVVINNSEKPIEKPNEKQPDARESKPKHHCAPAEELDRVKIAFEEELALRLADNAELYATKLEQVVRTQRQLFDIEKEDSVTNAIAIERQMHGSRIAHALTQLEAIEKALHERVAMDVENRRSKQVWLACQNLIDSIEHGKRGSCCMEGRRMPLKEQLQVLSKTAGSNSFVSTVEGVIGNGAKVKGEYTRADLKTRFDKVHKIGQRVSRLDENGGGIGAYLRSWIASSLTWKLPVDYKKWNKFDPESESNADLLDRARWHLKKEEYVNAVKIMQMTNGATHNVARDWIKDVRSHEETLMLARLLLAHAACTSVRSTY